MGSIDRGRWLFPAAAGSFQGIRLELLDPADEEDRSILVRAAHPELSEALEEERDYVQPGGEVVNPRLHVTMHEAVANQIVNDDPPEVWRTARRLEEAGYDRHEVLHMLASVLAEDIWSVQHDRAAFDLDRYRARLEALPGSWEVARAGALDEHDDLDEQDLDEQDLDQLDEHEISELADAALEVLGALGPLAPDELARQLHADQPDVELVLEDPRVVALGDSRLASMPALLAPATFTHRLEAAEAASATVGLGVDLAPLARLARDRERLDLAQGGSASVEEVEEDEDLRLAGPEGWLGTAAAGELVGFRLVPEGGVEMVTAPARPVVPDTLVAQLRSSFDAFGEGDGVPVEVAELFCQLAADAPALMAGILAPLSEVLTQAGFEVHDGYAGPVGTDWGAFDRLRHVVSVAGSRGLTPDDSHALVMVAELARLFRTDGPRQLDRGVADEVSSVVGTAGIGEAFAEATEDHPLEARAFLVAAGQRASRGRRAGLAWAESLVASHAGALEEAEECLRVALALDADHEPALEDAAWYASDRGDAGRAVRLLERLEEDPAEARIAMLRGYAGALQAVSVGRNDPCPCGSGRKYKHCCLRAVGTSAARPLNERVRWVWEKLRWWLDRDGPQTEMLEAALELHGGPPEGDQLGFLVDLDVAASLVLFADGAVEEFLRRRGPLLPDDERNLVTQWALGGHSVFEVAGVHPGTGLTIRDLRTGDRLEVTERRGSASVEEGDLLFAHPVFDGSGHQFVGGVVPVPLLTRDALLAVLDRDAHSAEIAHILGVTRRLPQILNMEGQAMVLCEATYRVTAPALTARQLDAALKAGEGGVWEEWVEVDDRPWLRSQASLSGDVLTLSANSEERFDRLRDRVCRAVPGLELISEERIPAAESLRRAASGGKSAPLRSEGGGTGEGPPPEAAQALDAFIREQEVRWLDEPVPALAGLTPRQAAADPTRQEDLRALLHEFERHAPPPGAVSFDARRLRGLLGLPES